MFSPRFFLSKARVFVVIWRSNLTYVFLILFSSPAARGLLAARGFYLAAARGGHSSRSAQASHCGGSSCERGWGLRLWWRPGLAASQHVASSQMRGWAHCPALRGSFFATGHWAGGPSCLFGICNDLKFCFWHHLRSFFLSPGLLWSSLSLPMSAQQSCSQAGERENQL